MLFLKLNSLLHYRTLITQAVNNPVTKAAVNLSFKIIGEGTTEVEEPPIFILHGLLVQKRDWKSIAKTILNMTKRTVVTVDLRNHGASPHINSNKYEDMAADMIHLMDKLRIQRGSLVGHCIGGRMAMCTALMSPERVSGILVVDISPMTTCEHMKSMIKILNAIKAVTFKNPTKLNAVKKEAMLQLKSVINDDYTMNLVTNNLILKEGKICWTYNLEVLIKQFNNLTSFPVSLRGKKYNGPSMFIGGQLSEYLPADDLLSIREMFPQAVIRYIPKTGHNLHIEDPKSFLELTIEFLRSNH